MAQKINVDVTPGLFQQTLYYHQGDVGREFEIAIVTKDGYEIPSGATFTIQATKPSGFGFTVTGTATGNVVAFTSTEEMTDEFGRFPAQLKIADGTDTIFTANFLMVGEIDVHPDGTTDGSQETIIPTLTLLVERVENAAAAVLDTTTEVTTLPAGSQATYSFDEETNTATFGIPQGEAGAGSAGVVASAYSASKTYAVGDYAIHNSNLYRCTTAITTAESFTASHWTQVVLADDVTDLKSDIDPLYLAETLAFEQGSLRVNNGGIVGSDFRIRTINFLPNFMMLKAKAGYSFLLFAYSDNNTTYIGHWDKNNEEFTNSEDAATITWLNYMPLMNLPFDYHYKIVLKKDDGTDVTTSDSSNFLLYDATDKSLSDSDKSADAKVVGDKFKKIDVRDIGIIASDAEIIMDSYSGVSWMDIGAINGSGAEASGNTSYRSVFLPCWSGSKITSDVTLVSYSGVGYYHYVCFYDENKTFLSRTGGSRQNTVIANAPINAAFYRVSLTYVKVGNVATYSLTNKLNNTHAVAPRTKWYVLGDSISAGYYSMTASMASEAGLTLDYNSPVTTEGGEATGSVWDSSLEHNYWGYANKWFLHHQDLIGRAYPGQGYFRIASNDENGVHVVDNNDFSDAGLITIAWGFNDWHYNQPRGNHTLIDNSIPVPTDDFDTTQITTVNHAIWYCLGRLIKNAPLAKIVVQTPMNGWAYGGDFSTNWSINYAKSQSDTLKDIHDDIIYWCDYYGLQYIDMTFNNSVVNRVNIKDTIIDGSHPSDDAHKQLARTVWTKIGY